MANPIQSVPTHAMRHGPGDRPSDVLLSALAEAPDFRAAAVYLLEEIQAMLGSSRAILFRFEPTDESLVLSVDPDGVMRADHAGTQLRAVIQDRTTPG